MGRYLSSNASYDFKGKKELLIARNQDPKKVTRVAGQAQADGFEMERCNTYVVEIKSKDPNYIYSKRVWYVDAETYMIQYQEMYDQLGQYWKFFMQPTGDIKTAQGEMKSTAVFFEMHDFQRTHSGFTRNDIQKVSHNVKSRLFLLSNLQKSY